MHTLLSFQFLLLFFVVTAFCEIKMNIYCGGMYEPGQQVRVRHLSLSDLMPPTEDYMTYEGSMTQPGCHETITWIVMNKPVYITIEQVSQGFN